MIPRPAIIQRACVGLLLVLLLAACAASPAPPEAAPTAAAGGSTTLVLWHGWAGPARQVLGQLVDRFNQAHPAGRIILQAVPLASFDADLRSALAAGGGPHIMLIPNSWVGSLAERGVLLPLDELIDQPTQRALLPAALAGGQAPGAGGAQQLFGVPVSIDTLALFYDRRNLLRAPDDTDTLIASAHGLSDPGAPRWGLAINLSLDNTIGYLYAANGQVFDEQGGLALAGSGRAGGEQWLGWLKQLHDDRQLLVRADSSIEIDRAIKGGRVLITFDWAHQLGFYRSLWGSNLGIAALPRFTPTNRPPQALVRSDVLAINARAAAGERHAALAFLAYLAGAEAQAELLRADVQPARADLALADLGLDDRQAAAAAVFRAQALLGRPQSNGPARELVRRELALMLRQALHGDATPADALSEADQRLREQLGIP